MDKRYQVFVSSTYADLANERQKVIQSLMEMDCIPAGMEIFPATDEEQLAFIKKVIDDCDYYLLIIGGRYGSTDENGLSYTEKEYDYAVESDIPVIALLHSDPGQIASSKTDQNDELAQRLEEFRDKVSKGRLVKFWDNADQLPGLVALSLSKTIKAHPAIGWIRADKAAPDSLYQQVSELSKENAELREKINEAPKAKKVKVENLADLDDTFVVFGEHTPTRGSLREQWSVELTWGEIFSFISPYLMETPNDIRVKRTIEDRAFRKTGNRCINKDIDDQCFQQIKIQLMALDLVKVQYAKTTSGSKALFWKMTDKGHETMVQRIALKKQ
ncbi:hypothetical protein CK501_15905 [Halovibrio salipaludis]|uniref:DUF4062 domain-containing protein n=1 Tax=Halovibrio salipaludis TaxID=2032626 RepID=A0A2A2EVL1_9GAMM|nr:DUF4062 domain-containing protein [Halovibrio salipaludis]PAU76419.1 hypothetical protein CK501_15905 [Halovibrio salipaludis]